jgi:hypothetical protein
MAVEDFTGVGVDSMVEAIDNLLVLQRGASALRFSLSKAGEVDLQQDTTQLFRGDHSTVTDLARFLG